MKGLDKERPGSLQAVFSSCFLIRRFKSCTQESFLLSERKSELEKSRKTVEIICCFVYNELVNTEKRRSTFRSMAQRAFGWWKKAQEGMEGSLGVGILKTVGISVVFPR